MTATLSCDSLPSSPAHQILDFLTNRSKRGLKLVNLNYAQIALRALGTDSLARTETAVKALQELSNEGYVDRVEEDVWEVLVLCNCSDPSSASEEFLLQSLDGRRSRLEACSAAHAKEYGSSRESEAEAEKTNSLLSSSDANGDSAQWRSLSKIPRRWSRSPAEYLARIYFRQICRENRLGTGFQAAEPTWWRFHLVLKTWMANGLTPQTITQMMDEFGKHRAWCQRSTKPVWLIFVFHKQELLNLVARQLKKREASDHRNDEAWWLDRGDPISETEKHRYDPDWWLTDHRTGRKVW